jgi:hypothetical protein
LALGVKSWGLSVVAFIVDGSVMDAPQEVSDKTAIRLFSLNAKPSTLNPPEV